MEKTRLDQILQSMFRIRKGELEKTFLMFLYSFNAVAVFIIARIMKDTLFLNKSDLALLPYMYVAVGVAVGVVMYAYYRLAARQSLQVTVNSAMGLFLILFLVFRGLLEIEGQDWIVPSLYIFVEIMGIILVIQFWTFANELFNSREAKRLFGIIGAGAVTANLYSFPIREFSKLIGIKNLSFVCAFSLFLCILIFNYLSRKYKNQVASHLPSEPIGEEEERIPPARMAVYNRLKYGIVALTMITILAVTFVDYQFKVTARHAFQGQQLANFFFNLYAYGGMLACLVQLFGTNRILERFGVLPALLLLPIMLLTGSTMALAWIGYIGITFTKGSELVTRYTVYEATTNLLYQPLPSRIRRKVKAISDGIARPMAQSLAGLAFIALNALFSINHPDRIGMLAWFVVVAGFVWIGVLIMVRRRYVDALLIGGDRNARGWESGEEDLTAAIPRMAIKRALESGDELQILNAIEMLPSANWHDWEDLVVPLHENESARVRMESLRYLAASGNRKYSRLVLAHFEESEEEVGALAIRLYCQLESERAVTMISQYLDSHNPQVKAATITGLIKYGGLDGMLSSVGALKKMITHSDSRQREMGAKVLGFIKIESLHKPLLDLVNDPDTGVRRAAIEAAGELRASELIPSLIYQLGNPETAPQAMSAIAAFGDEAVESLNEVLELSYLDAGIERSIAQVLGMIGSDAAADLLMRLIATPDEHLRGAAIKALQRVYGKVLSISRPDMATVKEVLNTELEHYYQLLQDMQVVEQEMDSPLLLSALEDRLEGTLKRVFVLLSLIYPRRQIEIVSYNIDSNNPALRANSIEIIDNILEVETRRYLLPILDSISREEKISRGQEHFQLEHYGAMELLERHLSEKQGWLLICAIYTVGVAKIEALADLLPRFLSHENPVVRETAIFALSKLYGGERFCAFAKHLEGDDDQHLGRYLASLLEAQQQES